MFPRSEAFMPKPAKKRINVTVDPDLLDEAKALDLNLSAELEARLREVIVPTRIEAWHQANDENIAAYNRRVKSRTIPTFGTRTR
ncbi:type II toxin-antitoxin system CcdA family antitoxin [Spiribacter vilamensis]|uniref:Antitoxin CcdA n=1 Tax=Spiribacter vilamensis TaxID=531306 RepID=A0A4Q8D1E5_9GAMM|nr:type II toxin-antitoxin system CcdA family antitoxin [Spiribacter vilamensis]RZU99077.1 antitoxin CcdA [Spiribacter vilamensis]TVO61925.1 acetoacetyl-CoA synthase [Spiribacter vilamensis]